MSDTKVSIIIPVYNEIGFINMILEKIEQASFANLKKEIIIIDDGSSDGTTKVLKELQNSSDFKIHFHDKNLGKGAAIRTALRFITGDIVVIQDADLEYDPQEYDKILDLIVNNQADVVYGSRFLGNKHKRSFNFPNMLFNKFITFMTNFLYRKKMTDIETCYKAFRASIIKNITIKANGFNFDPEITSKILKSPNDIHEIPISYSSRSYKEGKKIKFTDAFGAIYTLLKYRFSV